LFIGLSQCDRIDITFKNSKIKLRNVLHPVEPNVPNNELQIPDFKLRFVSVYNLYIL